MTEILLINEVTERLRMSQSIINRWLGQARRGESTFPLPISVSGGKGRWLAENIEWVASQYVRDPFPTKKNGAMNAAKQEHMRNARQTSTGRWIGSVPRGIDDDPAT